MSVQAQSSGGPVGQLVVTADMIPPPPEPLEAQAKHHRAIAVHLEELHQQLVAANTLREQSAQSRGFDEGHQVNRQFAANVATAQSFHEGVATMFSAIAGVYRDVAAQQHSIVHTAQQEVAAAKTPGQIQAIIASHHAYARGVTTSGIEFATAQHGHFQAKHGADYTALVGHDRGLPERPAPAPAAPDHGRIIKPVDHNKPKGDDGAEDAPQTPGKNQPASVDDGSDRGRMHPGKTSSGDGAPGDAPPGTPGTFPGAPMSPTQLPIRSTGFGGGSSGGGGMGGMSPGGLGGGLGGLGSGNPMSGLSSGLGRVPSSAGGGLSSGLSGGGGVPSGLGQPSAAFAQGLSAGSAGGSVAHSLPPAAASGASPAPGGVPAAGLSTGQAMSSGVGSSGSHFAPAVSAGSAAVGSGPPAMMLPSPGMGAPAAPVSAAAPAGTAGAPTMPAGTSGAAGGGSGSGTGSPGGAGGGTGAVVPAVVTAPGNGRASAARIRSESPELLAAKALARQLRRDSDAAGYPIIEWVVGVFRSDTDQTTETVFMSSEGFGYIPHGVFVPRSARLLAVDPLVDNGFRERWFGWRDPSRVLVEYAQLRRPGGARLVAAAATHEVETLRTHGVEHALCAREDSTQLSMPPVLDDMHAHRLAVQCPSLYPRVTQLAACNDAAVLNQVIVPIVMQMMDGVQHGGGGVDCPPELRQMWDALGSGDEIPESAWKEFDLDTNVYYAITGASAGRSGDSPDDVALTGGGAVYQAQWLIARTMEVVRGWGQRPPPLADMVYAAAAAYPGDFSAKLDPMLRPLEADAALT